MLGEIDKKSYDKYYKSAPDNLPKDKKVEYASGIIKSKLNKAFTDLQRLESRKAKGPAVYGKNEKSVAQGRFNESASDVNLYNSKGVLRMAHSWGNTPTTHIPSDPTKNKQQVMNDIVNKGLNLFRDLPPGEQYGWALDKRLKQFEKNNPGGMQILDTMYAIGRAIHLGAVPGSTESIRDPNNPDVTLAHPTDEIT